MPSNRTETFLDARNSITSFWQYEPQTSVVAVRLVDKVLSIFLIAAFDAIREQIYDGGAW